MHDGPVFVETAARLHFGVLDLRGSLGRWFGGIGTSAPAPSLLVSARRAGELRIDGQDADRAKEYAERFLAFHRLPHDVAIHVHRALPAHAGLGSGTQLALAIARAIAELHGLPADGPTLAHAVGRARRSAVGTWTFDGGGLVVEGGRREEDDCGPLIARLPFPTTWRCVVAIPDATPGISGIREAEAFAHLPSPPNGDVGRVAHLVLMALLPSLADDDIVTFGKALTEIQEITGRWFASVQGGMFTPGPSETLVHRMREWGANGVGQSSWGPTVYGIVKGEEEADTLSARVRDALGSAGVVYEGPFRSSGARVWREPFASNESEG